MYLSIIFPAQLCASFCVSVFVQQIIKTAEYFKKGKRWIPLHVARCETLHVNGVDRLGDSAGQGRKSSARHMTEKNDLKHIKHVPSKELKATHPQ